MEDNKNHVFTEIEINASPEEVWSVLTDWYKLKEWSSSFIGISTDQMIRGETFVSYFKNPLGGVIELEHVCSDYEEGIKFGWSGDIIGHTQDHHIYSVEPTQNGTTLFKQEDGLHGPHSRLLNFLAEHQMMSMYKKFNHVTLVNGSDTIKVTPFQLADLGDSENNIDLCLKQAGIPILVEVKENIAIDPNNDKNPKTQIKVLSRW